MEPSMSPAAKRDSLEPQLTSVRDALLQATCALLEGLGFKTTAWTAETYNLLNDAFSACAETQLPPCTVISKLLQAIDKEDPRDNREELLSIIVDIIADLENPTSPEAVDHNG